MKKMLQTLTRWFMVNWLCQTEVAETQLPDDPSNLRSTSTLTHYSFVRRLVLTCLIIFSVTTLNAQTQTVILTSGSSWTVPSNVYSITVECWGGGGGGSNTTTAGRSGGGGGGGAYAKKNTITVTPGNSISYSIGGGGSGSSAGGDTWFNSTSTVLAKGGSGGASNGTSGGTGGSAAASVGDVKYDGGKGGNGTGTGCCDGAGGGGSGAGSTGNGNAGSNGSSNTGICTSGNDVSGGGLKVDYGGDGGVGVGYDGDGGGAYGYSAGGGGAKSGCISGTNRTGGSGKQGLIRITYCYSPSSTNAGADVTICSGGSTTLSGSATAYSGISQLLLQDFENSLTGWSITNTGTSSARFIWTYGPVSTGQGTANSGNPSLIWANGDNSSTNSSTTLTSPSFSTVGYSSLNLTFRHHYDDYDAGDFAYVEVYNGSSWVTVQTYTTDQGALTNFATASVNLNSYVGISNFAIRFRYVNNNDWHWLIDDISVTGNISPAVSYSWSPATGLSATNIANPVASPSSTQTYTLTTSHNGCSTTSDAVVVTVRPVFNGGTIASSSQIACYGTQPADITYTTAPSGGSTPRYQWYKQTGVVSCPTGSFNGTGWTAVGTSSTSTPTLTGAVIGNMTATTTFALRVDNAGSPACFDNWAGNCHVVYVSGETAPISGDVLATTTSTRTCVVNDNLWHYFRNNSGQIIAAINSNGQNLGSVTITVTIETVTHDGTYLSPKHGNGGLGRNGTCYGMPELSMRRWYAITITGTNPPASPSSVRLFFTSADYTNYSSELVSWDGLYSNDYPACYGYTVGAADLVVSKDETNDLAPTGASVSGGPGSSSQYDISVPGFSTFRFHTKNFVGSPLPVELVSFTGSNIGDHNRLDWVTASEQNTEKFVIEKSTDVTNWVSIGEIQAAGNSSTQLSYYLNDYNPVMGNNYYRLKTIDLDGKSEYSNTINVPVSGVLVNAIVGLYPNPVENVLNVDVQSTQNFSTEIKIYNVLGEIVVKKPFNLVKGINKLQFNSNDLPQGSYILEFTDAVGKTHVQKFVKQ